MNGPQFISKERYKRAMRINWKTPHTRRLQQIIGDDKLVVGFDGRIKKWVIARLCKRYIVESYGRREFTSEVNVPMIWKTWEEGVGGRGLPITHPELPEYIMSCDRWRRAKELDKQWDYNDQIAKWSQEAKRREKRDIAKEIWNTGTFQKMADSLVGATSQGGPGRYSMSFMADAYAARQ